ncbi:hypothetical protein Pelo_5743 [Pelomyxa schiedti]|nr:hypothetical protein Pelo_5743 [Pelomyxa schiedti]
MSTDPRQETAKLRYVEDLQQLYPEVSTSVINTVVTENKGDLDAANGQLKQLCGDIKHVAPAAADPDATQTESAKLANLRGIFHDHSEEQLRDALRDSNGDPSAAAMALLTVEPPPKPEPPASEPPSLAADPHPAARYSQIVRDLEEATAALVAAKQREAAQRQQQQQQPRPLSPPRQSPSSNAAAAAASATHAPVNNPFATADTTLPAISTDTTPTSAASASSTPEETPFALPRQETPPSTPVSRSPPPKDPYHTAENEGHFSKYRPVFDPVQVVAPDIPFPLPETDNTTQVMPSTPLPAPPQARDQSDVIKSLFDPKPSPTQTNTVATAEVLTVKLKEDRPDIIQCSWDLRSYIPNPSDWIALFIHDREFSHSQYEYLGSQSAGTLCFKPVKDGYYDVRIYNAGSPPTSPRLKSDPILVGSIVKVSARVVGGSVPKIAVTWTLPASPVLCSASDWIGLYENSTRSNRLYLSWASCEKSCVLFDIPKAPELYDVRYFKAGSGNAYSGHCSIAVPNLNDIQVTAADSFLQVTWMCMTHPSSTWDWVGLFRVPGGVAEAERVTWNYCSKGSLYSHHGNCGVVRFDASSLPRGEYQARYWNKTQNSFLLTRSFTKM